MTDTVRRAVRDEGRIMTFEIELLGGHADGRTFTLSDLPSHFNVPAPAAPAVFRPATDVLDVSMDVTTYTREHSAATGEPRRTAEGRYIYRHGARPAYPADLPLEVGDRFPRAHGWQRLGEGRWRAVEPAHQCYGEMLLYVMVMSEAGRKIYAGQRVSRDMVREAADDVELEVWHNLAHECRYQLLPGCVVPDCSEKGRMLLHASASGCFASRAWEAGEEIRLCPAHYHDVLLAQGQMDVERLPEWLRVDASAPPDWWDHEVRCFDAGTILPIGELRDPWKLQP